MYFLITIDTEADNQWATPAPNTTENIRCISCFQARRDRCGFKSTYLCTYEMVENPLLYDTIGPYQCD